MLQAIKRALAPKQSPEQIQAIIESIHYDFDTAGEKLLQEAKKILAEKYLPEKGERLSKLGFRSAKPVVEFNQIESERKEKEKLSSLIEQYKVRYPNNKFITEDIVKTICKKYGLLLAPISNYKGDVPEKNISEMEKFELNQEDMVRRTNYDDYMDMYMSQSLMQARFRSIENRSLPLTPPSTYTERFEKPEFMICATEKDLDISDMKKVDYKLIVNLPDPIVLQPINGGYLIVSKWGLESQDQELTNESHN